MVSSLVIFSNQGGFGKEIWKGKRATATRARIDGFIRDMGLPMEAYCATGKDQYRKPGTGMWDYVAGELSPECKPQVEGSFYVGDAAGMLNKTSSYNTLIQQLPSSLLGLKIFNSHMRSSHRRL